MTTMGDVHPHLKADPRFAELAAKPYPWPPHPGSETPGILAMAKGLATAAKDVVTGDYAPPEVQADREAACLACPHQVDQAKGCSVCTCGTRAAFTAIGMDMVLKRKLANSRCPLDPPRWGAVT